MKKSVLVANNLPTFWSWFLRGVGAKAGYRRVLNRWCVLHLLVGTLGALLIEQDLAGVAKVALLPLMAIFIGLTFSWAGNAHSLLQSNEVIDFARARAGGVAEYIFAFQISILVILVAVLCWVIPVLELRFLLGDYFAVSDFNFLASVLLYSLLSLSFRTSWQAVLGANMLLLVRAKRIDEKTGAAAGTGAGRTVSKRKAR